MTPTDPYRISNSEIQMFQRCRRKWWLSYIERWTPKLSAGAYVGPLALGSRIHAVLEQKYKHGADPLAVHATLVDEARMLMSDDGFALDKLHNEAELGRIMLEGYEEWVDAEGLDSGLDIIGVEQVLERPMLDGKVILMGKLDLRIARRRDDTRAALDFKTSANFNDLLGTMHMAPQLLTYMTLDHVSGPGAKDKSTRIDGAVYRMLKKVKRGPRAIPPFYQEVTVRHNVFTLRSFWRRLQGLLIDMYTTRRAIEEGGDTQMLAYPTPNRNCTWDCPFFKICFMFDDGSGVDDALDADFVRHDPYAYYGDREPGSE